MVTHCIICSGVVQWSRVETFAGRNAEKWSFSLRGQNWSQRTFFLSQFVYTSVCLCKYKHMHVCDRPQRKVVIRGECNDYTLKLLHWHRSDLFVCVVWGTWRSELSPNLITFVCVLSSLSVWQVQSRSTETASASVTSGWTPPLCSPLPPPHLLLCHQNVSYTPHTWKHTVLTFCNAKKVLQTDPDFSNDTWVKVR